MPRDYPCCSRWKPEVRTNDRNTYVLSKRNCEPMTITGRGCIVAGCLMPAVSSLKIWLNPSVVVTALQLIFVLTLRLGFGYKVAPAQGWVRNEPSDFSLCAETVGCGGPYLDFLSKGDTRHTKSARPALILVLNQRRLGKKES